MSNVHNVNSEESESRACRRCVLFWGFGTIYTVYNADVGYIPYRVFRNGYNDGWNSL